MTVSRGLNPDQLTLPPFPPAACHNEVLPRNSQVALLCGGRGNFLWEVIPTEYCNFYMRPHLVNTVDHTVGTCKPLSPFTEALWEGYNICTCQILNNDHLTDYCLAVYQQHESSCFRNMTRYTVKSVKKILLSIEKFKISGVSSAFCSCPPYTANTNSPIFCFTCIQLHCEVKSMYLESIENHFSYQNQWKLHSKHYPQSSRHLFLQSPISFPSDHFQNCHPVSQENDLPPPLEYPDVFLCQKCA